MTIKRQYDCDNINWEDVRTLLKEVGMSYSDVTVHELSFKNSYSRIFYLMKMCWSVAEG